MSTGTGLAATVAKSDRNRVFRSQCNSAPRRSDYGKAGDRRRVRKNPDSLARQGTMQQPCAQCQVRVPAHDLVNGRPITRPRWFEPPAGAVSLPGRACRRLAGSETGNVRPGGRPAHIIQPLLHDAKDRQFYGLGQAAQLGVQIDRRTVIAPDSIPPDSPAPFRRPLPAGMWRSLVPAHLLRCTPDPLGCPQRS